MLFINKYRSIKSRIKLFARRVFLKEKELLSQIFSKILKIPKKPVGFISIILISVIFHLIIFFFYMHFHSPVKFEKKNKDLTFQIKIFQPFKNKVSSNHRTPEIHKKNITSKKSQRKKDVSKNKSKTKEILQKKNLSVFGTGKGPTSQSGNGGSRIENQGSGRADLLKRFGGSKKTEQAVIAGLNWLALHQDADGGWNCDNFSANCPKDDICENPGSPQYDVGVTGLALTAFIARGTDIPLQWQQLIRRAVTFLLTTQKKSGNFGPEEASFMYNQAMATYALAQQYNQKPSPKVKTAIKASLDFIYNAQQAGGGWDYTSKKTNRNDLSITAWQLLSIDACKNAGFKFPENRIAKARAMINRMVNASKGMPIYADSGVGAGEQRPGLVPAAIIGLLLCNTPTKSPVIQELVDILSKAQPNPQATSHWNYTGQSFYYWYYGSIALFHIRGKQWQLWNKNMKKVLLGLQVKKGHATGSWAPESSWIGSVGGRVYSTAISVLTLEIYYRISPTIFSSKSKQ